MAIAGETPQSEASLAKLGSGLASLDQSLDRKVQTEVDIHKPNLGLEDTVSEGLEEKDSLKRAMCRSDRPSTNKSNAGVSLRLAQDRTHTFSTFGNNADIHFTEPTTSLTSDAPAQNERHPVPHGTLHFHRKQHHGHHDHKSSKLAPFTLTKGRKYILTDRTADPALTRSQEPVPDIDDLTHVLCRSNLSSNPAPRDWTPGEIARRLRHWTYDPYLMAESERRERENPFPGIDMNAGWNRARCNNALYFAEQLEWMNVHEGGPEARTRVKESLNSFSFWAQLEPIELDAEEVKGMFDRVFVGESYGRFGWARTPGSWWATRKGVFAGYRGVCFVDHVKEQTREILGKVNVWRRTCAVGESEAVSLSARKEFQAEVDEAGGNLASRKRQAISKASEEVMGEKWRARRREQEKKAGRWTDGTLRMDRLWEEFHWVLDN